MKIKTIDVNFKEWFDKVSGNSYCAGIVLVNYGLKSEKTFKSSFEYGYDDYYLQKTKHIIEENFNIKMQYMCLTQYCRENKIILRYDIARNCLKRKLESI